MGRPLRFLPLLALLALLWSCGLTVPPPPAPEPEGPPPIEGEPAAPPIGYQEDVSAHLTGNVNQTLLALPKAEVPLQGHTASVVLYLDAELDETGAIAWDDGCLQALLVRRGEGGYPLIPKQYVQGSLDCTVVHNLDDGGLTVLARYTASAGVILYAFTYDSAADAFVQQILYQTEGNVSVY